MSWIEILDNDIYYVEVGAGPPLVFLHGMSSCAEAWWQQFDHFAKNYRVIAYDSVNHRPLFQFTTRHGGNRSH